MNGRPEIRYVVVSDPAGKSYKSADVPKRFVTIWHMLSPGMEFTCKEFCDSHKDDLPKNQTTAVSLVGRALAEAAKVGILNKVENGRISKEFLNMRTVTFWLGQLRGSTRTNMTGTPSSTTRTSYVRQLWHFNKWLVSKKHVLHVTKYSKTSDGSVQISDMPWQPADAAATNVLTGGAAANTADDADVDDASAAVTATAAATTTTCQVRFDSVEDLIELLAKPLTVRADVAIIVKQYLMDPIHKGKRASTMCLTRNAILSYFKQNEQRLDMSFDPITTYDNSEIIQMLTLQNMHDMLTIGQPTAAEKAVMMCKLHRGLDVSTLIDRFNFEAWNQITQYFGTDDYNMWNLDMCPVPITLTRLKTGYTHRGFLERDAVTAIQKYLNWRRSKTKREMDGSQPLFLTKTLKPIGNGWVTNAFSRLAWRSGVQQKIGKNAWRVDSHEMRSLLKSTLIECGCRMDIADHVIGHKPKDSYEKQAILYGDSVRVEYAKASHMLNIFSKAKASHEFNKRNMDDKDAVAPPVPPAAVLPVPPAAVLPPPAAAADTPYDTPHAHHILPHIKQWDLQESSTLHSGETPVPILYVGAKDKSITDYGHASAHGEAALRDVITRLASLSRAYTEEFQSVLATLVAKDDETKPANTSSRGAHSTPCDNDKITYNESKAGADCATRVADVRTAAAAATATAVVDDAIQNTVKHVCSKCCKAEDSGHVTE